MALSVIGAGFGRTGTESLKKALEILGFDPCYHMYEVLPRQDRVDAWVGLAQGAVPDWDQIFEGYRASVDWPGAHYWRQLADHYFDAKIILSVRDSESWCNSMANTILPVLRRGTDPNSLGNQMFIPIVFKGDIDDRDHVISIYERHNEAVKAAIPADRLLIYQLGSGWAPLCQFLDVEVPDVDYPRGNDADQFEETMDRVTEERTGNRS